MQDPAEFLVVLPQQLLYLQFTSSCFCFDWSSAWATGTEGVRVCPPGPCVWEGCLQSSLHNQPCFLCLGNQSDAKCGECFPSGWSTTGGGTLGAQLMHSCSWSALARDEKRACPTTPTLCFRGATLCPWHSVVTCRSVSIASVTHQCSREGMKTTLLCQRVYIYIFFSSRWKSSN